MSSRKTEQSHVEQLKKLLSESGLQCIRPAPESSETENLSGENKEISSQIEYEEESFEEVPEEECLKPEPEVAKEEEPEVFPTPSLRRIVPEHTRKIEESNRIHVLPEVFRKDIDPSAIPRIAHTAPQKYINTLAELVGCTEYKTSLAEYWFLDTMANLLRRAQEDNLYTSTQALLMIWFCEWIKEVQHFDAADRQRMLRRFKDNMLTAAKFVAEDGRIPTPSEVNVYYTSREEELSGSPLVSKHPDADQAVIFDGLNYECSLKDLTQIIHYIYDLFSTDYQYELVRSIFTFPPDYVHVDAPHQIVTPRHLYAPLKPKTKEKSPKKETKGDTKGGKGRKSVTPDTEEFLALMELKQREERELEEREQREREEYNLRSAILPLNLAADEAFFTKYWPPPPPEPLPEPDQPSAKGKRKKTTGK